MAGKNVARIGKLSAKASDKRVVNLLEAVTLDYLSLSQMAEKMASMPLDFFSIRNAFTLIVQKIDRSYQETVAHIAPRHPALVHVGHARHALKTLAEFMDLADAHEQADRDRPAQSFLRLVGHIALRLIAEAGRHGERAALALFAKHTGDLGYLRGHQLDGEDMLYVTEQERDLIFKYRRFSDENKTDITWMIDKFLKEEEQKQAAVAASFGRKLAA